MAMYKFENLKIWRLAVELIEETYKINKLLPRSEKDNLIDQLQRAATSVALNIAEGSAANNDIEFRRYLLIGKRSLVEVVAILRIIKKLYNLRLDSIEEKTDVLIKQMVAMINVLSKAS